MSDESKPERIVPAELAPMDSMLRMSLISQGAPEETLKKWDDFVDSVIAWKTPPKSEA
jgi:hypothetical protein